MKALATWSGALAGLLLILIGGLLPSALLIPSAPLQLVDLPATWQVPALLLCALVSGPRAGMMAAVAYLSLGLTDEAQTAGAILGHNFRGTSWYRDSYALLTGRGLTMEARGDSWLSAVYRQVLQGEWL